MCLKRRDRLASSPNKPLLENVGHPYALLTSSDTAPGVATQLIPELKSRKSASSARHTDISKSSFGHILPVLGLTRSKNGPPARLSHESHVGVRQATQLRRRVG